MQFIIKLQLEVKAEICSALYLWVYDYVECGFPEEPSTFATFSFLKHVYVASLMCQSNVLWSILWL